MYLVVDQSNINAPRSRMTGPVMGSSVLQALDREIPFGGFAIKYVMHGTERYTVNGNHYAVRDGSYLLANAHCRGRVSIESAAPVLGLCADLTPGVLNGMVSACTLPEAMDEPSFASFFTSEEFPENIHTASGTHVGVIMQRLSDVIHVDPYRAHDIGREVYLALAEAVIADHWALVPGLRRIGAIRSGTRKDLLRRVERARAFMHANQETALDVGVMASEAAMSEFHFFRAFRALHGITPHQYHLALRLVHGREMIMKGAEVSIAAMQCGFPDLASFSKAFKRRFGQPPSATVGGSSRI
ncbi:MAG: helix-turn-helix transcriptional regulator [Flavobacteriales bacterium]|nr:helix-turn-helix transcriptional regulator [Flavobacteriales bacterium]MBP6699053.1 helix-turn-helix transcriptional regulator [Flavobacteriales bacterium]